MPRLQAAMLRNFAANPVGGKFTNANVLLKNQISLFWEILTFSEAPCRSMFLSTFSHYTFFHIFANMYVLHSFSNAACMTLGKEQTLAVYLTAGCIASFASYVHKVFRGVGGSSLGAVSG